MNILGLSFFYHDSAACLVQDGVIVAASQEERFSRRKSDSAFPTLAIEFVLSQGGVQPDDLEYVVFYEKPLVKFERIFKTNLLTWPQAPSVFRASTKDLFFKKLWVRQLIASELGIDSEKVLFSDHHISHAASSFFCSPFEKAAILTVDGVGEWTTTACGVGEGNTIEIHKEMRFPHSLGLLYSAVTAFLGFKVNEGEYKVMGMAPYGTPKYKDEMYELVTIFDDCSYTLNLKFFKFHRSLYHSYSKELIQLLGKPRDPKSKFFTRDTGWPSYFGKQPQGEAYEQLAQEQERYADIAASLQVVLEEMMLGLLDQLHRETGCDKLCIAGGVGLNSVANERLLREGPFDDLYIQPAAGDAGGALGAALAVYYSLHKREQSVIMTHAYYGRSYSNEEIKAFLNEQSIAYQEIEEDKIIDFIASRLEQGDVIGYMHGAFEWGPRALGHRSIIADPRRAEMKDIINTKIKFREPYRPFAPSVLVEHAENFFDMPSAYSHYPGRFMLSVVPVKKDKQAVVPAITHVNGTARPQLVHKEESPRYWNIINTFYQRTNIPMVVNTSFNVKGQPIVASPADALWTFKKSELDLLVMENIVVYRDALK